MKKPSNMTILWLCIAACFLLMASPLVLLLNKFDNLILGVPVLYGFVFFLWMLLCVLTFIGYKLRWGDKKESRREKSD